MGVLAVLDLASGGARPKLVAIRALQKLRQRQDLERQTATMANIWTENGLVFTNLTGGPMDTETATKSFQKVLKREGLPRQRFHDLRHACASLLLAQGVDLKVIQEILGHSTIRSRPIFTLTS